MAKKLQPYEVTFTRTVVQTQTVCLKAASEYEAEGTAEVRLEQGEWEIDGVISDPEITRVVIVLRPT